MRVIHTIHLSLFVTLLGCSEEKEENESFCEITPEHRTITQESASREYLMVVPDSYDGSGSALPLILNFHGSGGCADEYMESESDFVGLSNTRNFLLAYPQGLPDAEGYPGWRPVDDGSVTIQDNDFVFVDRIVSDIASEYNVNLEQVYAVGLSNGGMMAYGLACRRSETFAAVGVMSGMMLTDTCHQGEYTSVIHFHGTSDTIVPLEGNQDFPPVMNGIDYWVSHNGASPNPTTVELDDGEVVQDTYSGGSEDTSVVLYTIQDGYHVWFDDPIGGQEPNQIIWDFLSRYTLSGFSD